MQLLHTVRQPEYVGENRCLPCTVVNLAIAALLAAAVLVVGTPLAAVAVFALCAAVIYLRGYLVPGTPTLTKRYLPDRVLRLFDHHDAPQGGDADLADVSVEDVLVSADVLHPVDGGADLALDDAFRHSWRGRIDALHASGDDAFDPRHVRESFNAGELGDDLDLESIGEDAVTAYVDDVRIAQWESRAAYLADAAAADLLAERLPDWERYGFDARTEVLAGLRLWLARCPTCEGAVVIHEDAVESCCRTIDVVAADCEACGSRLFEIDRSAV